MVKEKKVAPAETKGDKPIIATGSDSSIPAESGKPLEEREHSGTPVNPAEPPKEEKVV